MLSLTTFSCVVYETGKFFSLAETFQTIGTWGTTVLAKVCLLITWRVGEITTALIFIQGEDLFSYFQNTLSIDHIATENQALPWASGMKSVSQ